MKFIKSELSAKLKSPLKARDLNQPNEEGIVDQLSKGFSTMLKSLFGTDEAAQQPEQVHISCTDDKRFMRKLRNEIKHFEICQRMFEESYIAVVMHIQKEYEQKTSLYL